MRDEFIAHVIQLVFKVVSKSDLSFVVVYIDLFIVGIAFNDKVFPINPTIFIAVPVEYLQLAHFLVPREGVGTKEALANLPDIRPHTHILSVVAKRCMRAVDDCLQCHLSTTK
jgi:hypothetical protein